MQRRHFRMVRKGSGRMTDYDRFYMLSMMTIVARRRNGSIKHRGLIKLLKAISMMKK